MTPPRSHPQRSRITSRLRAGALIAGLGGGLVALVAMASSRVAAVPVAAGLSAEIVVSGLARPIQLALGPARSLVVLSHGAIGDAAAEIVAVDLNGPLPIDGARLPRVVIPFAQDPRRMVMGSLALDPRTGDVVLGEENGHRIYRLTTRGELSPLAVGLNHLVGGSGIAFDHEGRLVAIDFVSPETQLRSESQPPPALDWLAGEGYQGPMVFRMDLGEVRPLPRRLDLAAPLFPRGWLRGDTPPAARFVAVAASPGGGDIVLLDSLGQVKRLTPDGQLHLLAHLGSGHYHRTNMAVGPDGTVVVSTGFHIRRLLSISPGGTITNLAWDLGDPNGLVIDASGTIYLAETAHHRILRIAAIEMGGPERAPQTPPRAERPGGPVTLLDTP